MKKVVVLVVCIGTIVLLSCEHKKEEQKIANTTDSCNDSLTYLSGIKTLIDANCAYSGCHVAGNSVPDLTSYTLVRNNIEDIKERAIVNKSMPAPSGMSACNITKLDNWIKAGMPE